MEAQNRGRIDSYWGNWVGFGIMTGARNIKQNSENEGTAMGNKINVEMKPAV